MTRPKMNGSSPIWPALCLALNDRFYLFTKSFYELELPYLRAARVRREGTASPT